MGAALGHAAAYESRQLRLEDRTQRPAGERAAVQAAGGRGAGGHLAGRRAGRHHLRQPAHGPAARLPERRDAGPACLRLHRGGLARQRPAHAGAAFGRGRGEPRPPLPSPRRRRAMGTGLGQLRSWAATASSARWAWSPTSPSGSSAEERLRRSAERLGILHDMDRRSSPRARWPRSVAPRWAGSAGWCPASAARSCSSTSPGARHCRWRASPAGRRSPARRFRSTRFSPGEVLRRGTVRYVRGHRHDGIAAGDLPAARARTGSAAC